MSGLKLHQKIIWGLAILIFVPLGIGGVLASFLRKPTSESVPPTQASNSDKNSFSSVQNFVDKWNTKVDSSRDGFKDEASKGNNIAVEQLLKASALHIDSFAEDTSQVGDEIRNTGKTPYQLKMGSLGSDQLGGVATFDPKSGKVVKVVMPLYSNFANEELTYMLVTMGAPGNAAVDEAGNLVSGFKTKFNAATDKSSCSLVQSYDGGFKIVMTMGAIEFQLQRH